MLAIKLLGKEATAKEISVSKIIAKKKIYECEAEYFHQNLYNSGFRITFFTMWE